VFAGLATRSQNAKNQVMKPKLCTMSNPSNDHLEVCFQSDARMKAPLFLVVVV